MYKINKFKPKVNSHFFPFIRKSRTRTQHTSYNRPKPTLSLLIFSDLKPKSTKKKLKQKLYEYCHRETKRKRETLYYKCK